MFDFEDMSSGFHDVFLNKYSDSSGPILDFYISDSMQDMLDIDIRSEVATVVGGVNEFSSLMSDLPSLDFDSSSNDGDNHWLGGPKWSAAHDIYADVGACVNPNSVHSLNTSSGLPSSLLTSPKAQLNLNTHTYQQTPLPSPKEKKSHLTFSPNTIKVPVVHEQKKQSSLLNSHPQTTQRSANIETIKKDLNDDMNHSRGEDGKILKQFTQNSTSATTTTSTTINSNSPATNTIKLAAGIGGLTFANSFMYAKLKQNNVKLISSSNGLNNSLNKQGRDSSPQRQQNSTNSLLNNSSHLITNNGHQQNQKIFSRSIIVQQNNKNSPTQTTTHLVTTNGGGLQSSNNQNSKQVKVKVTGNEFPKPAYSYSCLIAMALKNSRAGSLPVSEIYSFMCEHFPYFKTAPNGWKNSVRHNLSLNKCFQKIEKPAVTGGQRKGCLWAMTPSKITKMDEEIQKWSKKDPMAIRKAMVYPENLELLERGEMKHGSSGDSEGENELGDEDTEENSDSEHDTEIDETIVNATEPEDEDEDDRSQMDFDIEVSDLYEEIDIGDSKDAAALHLTINQKQLLDLHDDDSPSSAKRERLDINYSIGPAGAFQTFTNGSHHHQSQQQPQQQNRRKMTLVNRIV